MQLNIQLSAIQDIPQQIKYGIQNTPFGDILIATIDQSLCYLQFCEPDELDTHLLAFQDTFSQSKLDRHDAQMQGWRDQLLRQSSEVQRPIAIQVNGTRFQLKVWQALTQIPYGERITYQALAGAISQPNAARAVGNAVGQNPVALFIPCHRVVRSSGALGGYRWGIERKAAILGWEACHLRQ
jgi:AraC family transcriptional regulator of adaptative response/methylated-DNA-[protein]-cysteine methyltransferase